MIRLRWSSSEEDMSYHLQLARDETFQTILVDQKIRENSIDLKKPDAPGIYYVRVSGVDADGNEGEFSTPEKVEIKEKFPATVFGVGAGILGTIGLILLLGAFRAESTNNEGFPQIQDFGHPRFRSSDSPFRSSWLLRRDESLPLRSFLQTAGTSSTP